MRCGGTYPRTRSGRFARGKAGARIFGASRRVVRMSWLPAVFRDGAAFATLMFYRGRDNEAA